jgi:hypothetical protein
VHESNLPGGDRCSTAEPKAGHRSRRCRPSVGALTLVLRPIKSKLRGNYIGLRDRDAWANGRYLMHFWAEQRCVLQARQLK